MFSQQGLLNGVVASYMGAWIETLNVMTLSTLLVVASYMGAWIETSLEDR